MQVDSVNIDPRQIYSTNFRYSADKSLYPVHTREEDERKHPDNLTKNERINLVSERLQDDSENSHTKLRFQVNSPVAKLLDVTKNFNETTKVETPQFKDSKFISNAQFTELSQKAANETPIGYYVVIDNNTKPVKQKAIKGRFELIKEKIAKTYNLGFKKENGTLVNITA